MNSTAIRPTLPPLHTLDLPRSISSKYPYQYNIPTLNVPRQLSFSSTYSRTPSPPPSNLYHLPHLPITTTTKPTFRLVPAPLSTATALVLVPPPTPDHAKQAPNQALLFLGPALQLLSHPGPARRIAHLKGARVHPYRVVRGR